MHKILKRKIIVNKFKSLDDCLKMSKRTQVIEFYYLNDEKSDREREIKRDKIEILN